jgi:thiazole/oxazole-forming peptide maturase SagC family component
MKEEKNQGSDDNSNSPYVYRLKEGVRIFYSGDEEIRFRKGVWSYNEAVIKLQGQEDKVKQFFTLVVKELNKTDEADVQSIAREVGAGEKELQSYCEILENLRAQGFLILSKDKEIKRIVNALIGGSISGFEQFVSEARPVLLVTDNEYAREAAKMIAGQIKLPLDIMDQKTFSELTRMDLTTKTEAVDYLKGLEKYQDMLSLYSCVIGSLVAPNVSLLRNLNRVLIKLEKPLILGFLDGPFMCLLSTLVNQTGCYECFEHRMLARLEDTVVYHKFVQSNRDFNPKNKDIKTAIFTPQVHMLTSAVISEGFLYATINMLRLVGRIVNVYLPILEIQVQDLLRVPYCPACGFISKAQMNEMYTSSRKIIDDMLDKIEITGKGEEKK